MFRLCQFLGAIPIKILYPTKFVGKKNVPKGGCIIASNHRSNMDVVLLGANTWEKKYYLAKKELFKGKFKSAILKSFGAIKIDRETNDVGAIKKSLSVLKAGKKLVIFPEGKRNGEANLGQIKQGIAMLAIKGQVPIVPMYIAKKAKIFRRNKIFFGEPFTLKQFYGVKLSGDVLAEATQIIEIKLKEIQDISINSLTKKK